MITISLVKKRLFVLTSMCLWMKKAKSPTTPVSAVPSLLSRKFWLTAVALSSCRTWASQRARWKPELSLGQIVDAVSAALGVKVAFAPDCAKASEAAAALKPGEALLLENLRFYPEEEGKPVGIDKADPAYDDAKKEMKAKQKNLQRPSQAMPTYM